MQVKREKDTPEKPQQEKAARVTEASGESCSSKRPSTRSEPADFLRWWREYQQKMKASFQDASLKLRTEPQ
jgi:hypothetical protein